MDADDLPRGLCEIADRAGDVAGDVAAVTVGLGILGINRLQVLRRQLASQVSSLRVPRSSDDS